MPLKKRRSGILLHPTSLPSSGSTGDLGPEAYRFVEFLASAGQTVWQVLPLAPTHGDGSPYQALSVHAGNPLLISPDLLMQQGWLSYDARHQVEQQEYDNPVYARQALLVSALQGFKTQASDDDRQAFGNFERDHAAWLEDYALYHAIKLDSGNRAWVDWPPELRDRHPQALDDARGRLAEVLEQIRFEQFVFFRQWMALKHHANHYGILIFGDMPIFVSHDSADVWANRQYFLLDEKGKPTVVAGVPPDYFSETGQRWGNPHYDWPRIQSEGFRWWIDRMRSQLTIYDLVRIDHFRGFEAFWEIPAGEETAINGRWVRAPGDDFFTALRQHFGASLPLVAEDLGVITPEVDALRRKYDLPGMKILQFAFDSDAENPYLPHNHEPSFVVYTGTHDNTTTLGWYDELSDDMKDRVKGYLGLPIESMPWPLIRGALASVARLAVIPMQDVLGLGTEARMNTPGTEVGNWEWRFSWDQVGPEVAARLRETAVLYGRCE